MDPWEWIFIGCNNLSKFLQWEILIKDMFSGFARNLQDIKRNRKLWLVHIE